VIESEETVDDIVDEELNFELSESEKQAISLYDSALLLLNSSRPDRKKAYNLLIESAKLDHQMSQEMVAKSYLFGDYLPIDVQMAKQYFTSLSLKGNSNAQMVSTFILLFFIFIYLSQNLYLFNNDLNKKLKVYQFFYENSLLILIYISLI
jgi:hypothetical protein